MRPPTPGRYRERSPVATGCYRVAELPERPGVDAFAVVRSSESRKPRLRSGVSRSFAVEVLNRGERFNFARREIAGPPVPPRYQSAHPSSTRSKSRGDAEERLAVAGRPTPSALRRGSYRFKGTEASALARFPSKGARRAPSREPRHPRGRGGSRSGMQMGVHTAPQLEVATLLRAVAITRSADSCCGGSKPSTSAAEVER